MNNQQLKQIVRIFEKLAQEAKEIREEIIANKVLNKQKLNHIYLQYQDLQVKVGKHLQTHKTKRFFLGQNKIDRVEQLQILKLQNLSANLIKQRKNISNELLQMVQSGDLLFLVNQNQKSASELEKKVEINKRKIQDYQNTLKQLVNQVKKLEETQIFSRKQSIKQFQSLESLKNREKNDFNRRFNQTLTKILILQNFFIQKSQDIERKIQQNQQMSNYKQKKSKKQLLSYVKKHFRYILSQLNENKDYLSKNEKFVYGIQQKIKQISKKIQLIDTSSTMNFQQTKNNVNQIQVTLKKQIQTIKLQIQSNDFKANQLKKQHEHQLKQLRNQINNVQNIIQKEKFDGKRLQDQINNFKNIIQKEKHQQTKKIEELKEKINFLKENTQKETVKANKQLKSQFNQIYAKLNVLKDASQLADRLKQDKIKQMADQMNKIKQLVEKSGVTRDQRKAILNNILGEAKVFMQQIADKRYDLMDNSYKQNLQQMMNVQNKMIQENKQFIETFDQNQKTKINMIEQNLNLLTQQIINKNKISFQSLAKSNDKVFEEMQNVFLDLNKKNKRDLIWLNNLKSAKQRKNTRKMIEKQRKRILNKVEERRTVIQKQINLKQSQMLNKYEQFEVNLTERVLNQKAMLNNDLIINLFDNDSYARYEISNNDKLFKRYIDAKKQKQLQIKGLLK